MKRTVFKFLVTIIGCLLTIFSTCVRSVKAQSSAPIVRAVLFYSPNCPHCQAIIQTYLPPILDQYGANLNIVGVDVSTQVGLTLYQAALERFQIPQERLGVPTLILGENVLVGDQEIPDRLPGLIEAYLAEGGLDWPDIPGLEEALGSPTPAVIEESVPTAVPLPDEPDSLQTLPTPTLLPGLDLTGGHSGTWQSRYALDPTGNTLSVVVLAAMLGVLVWTFTALFRTGRKIPPVSVSWAIPGLCLVGILVAGYLAFIETTNTAAVCGPVGDCNMVQQSEYARLFGRIPIGVLGLAGYFCILLAWLVARIGRKRMGEFAAFTLLGLTLAGVLFSIYLTFLEPFVIGATCSWCLTSSIVMTLLLLLSVTPGKYAMGKLFQKSVK